MVVQLVRMPPCHGGGRGFESRPFRKIPSLRGFLFMAYYVYILRSQVDGTYYKGFSEDYFQRLSDHNSGLSKFTASKLPWDLIYVEKHPDKTSALKREKKLKKCKKEYFEWLTSQPSNI
jgi:putative endonuclease